MLNMIKSHWSLVIAPAVLGVIGAAACITQAQDITEPPIPKRTVPVTLQIGDAASGISGQLFEAFDASCAETEVEDTHLTIGMTPNPQHGIGYDLRQREFYGYAMRPGTIGPLRAVIGCEPHRQDKRNIGEATFTVTIGTDNVHLVPAYIRADDRIHDYHFDDAHHAHATPIAGLQGTVEAQATTIAEQRVVIATVRSRVDDFLQPTVAAQATAIVDADAIAKEGRRKASTNLTAIGALRDRVTALESE